MRGPGSKEIRMGRVLEGKTSLAFRGIPHISSISLMKDGMTVYGVQMRY